MPTFDEIIKESHKRPVISPLPKLARFYLPENDIYESLEDFHYDLYDPEHIFERDVVLNADIHHSDYTRLSCEEDTVTPRLNEVVDWSKTEHHDILRQELLRQSRLKKYLLKQVTGENIVVLMIVDGLSFETIRNTNLPIRPVVVDGITTTEPGFKRIIYGEDNVSVYSDLLSKKGFTNKYGFTYWERGQEELSTDLHSAMGNAIHRIQDFSDVLDTISKDAPFRNSTYVQITRMGLDQDSHNRKEQPDQDAILENIISDIQDLETELNKQTDNWRVLITSDHGILWRSQLPHDPPVVMDDYKHHPRYVTGREKVPHSMALTNEDGDIVSGLAYPYLARKLKNTEWGVHGGFSYYESIVPLIELTSGDSQ